MKIAIIAWGSLVWDPRELPIASEWKGDGPKLKIEFSRVSGDGRLTLVIDPENGEEVQTYFAQSKRKDLGDAIADLRDREGTIGKQIGFVDLISNSSSGREFTSQVDIFTTIQAWCEEQHYDAAVWTALPSQFKERTELDFSVDNAIAYLRGLPKTAKKNALEYIKKAPSEVVTPVRRKIKELRYSLNG